MKLVNGKVHVRDKRDGPDGFFLDPLFVQLKKEAHQLKAAARASGTRFAGRMVLLLHEALSYRLLAELLYTANQAEFKSFQLTFRQAQGGLTAVNIDTPRLGGQRMSGGRVLAAQGVSVVQGPRGGRAEKAVAALALGLRRYPLWRGWSLADCPGSAVDRSGSPEYGKRLLELTALSRSNKNGAGAQPRPRSSPTAASTPVTKSAPRTTRAFPCRRRRTGGVYGPIGVLVSIDPQGRVDRVAVHGADSRMLNCCIRPWLSRITFNPRAVPGGTYSFVLQKGENKERDPLPGSSDLKPLPREVPGCLWSPLNLSVVVAQKGYYVKSQLGSEHPKKVPKRGHLSFTQLPQAEAIQALQRHLWHLYSEKYSAPTHWRYDDEERAQVTLIAEPEVPYGKVIAVIQALREAPPGRDAPPCRKLFDKQTRRWRVDPRSRHRCMYHRITLALGSS